MDDPLGNRDSYADGDPFHRQYGVGGDGVPDLPNGAEPIGCGEAVNLPRFGAFLWQLQNGIS